MRPFVLFSYELRLLLPIVVCGLVFVTKSYSETNIFKHYSDNTTKKTHFIAVTENFPPYSYIENKELKGISTEVVKALFETLDLDASIKIYPWSRAYKIALENKNTLIFTIAKTDYRSNQFKWVGNIAPGRHSIFSFNDNIDLVSKDVSNLYNYRTGTVKGTLRNQFLLANGLIEGINVLPVDQHEQNLKKLVKYKIDFWAANDLNARFIINRDMPKMNNKIIKRYELPLNLNLQLAFNKNTDDKVVTQFRNALKQIKQNGTYERILKKYNIKITPPLLTIK